MSKTRARTLSLSASALALAVTQAAHAQEACFVRLDSGTDLSGWHPSTTNHHGPGDNWVVEDGALVGRQKAGQQGGILMTDQSYSDVEVVFEVKIDWGCDSGFFFRTSGGDRAYQACLDHLPDSSVGSIYGEGFAGGLLVMPYTLTNGGSTAVVANGQTPLFDVAQWPSMWDPTEFNEVRARIEGSPPHLQIWVSGVKVADYQDNQTRAEIQAAGPLAIQVHGGGRWTADGSVRFRNIRVRDLTKDCVEPTNPGAGGGGAGGQAGSGGAPVIIMGGSAGSEAAGASAGSEASGGMPGGAPPVVMNAAPGGSGGAALGSAPMSVLDQSGGCGVAERGRVGGAAWLLLGLALGGRLIRRRA